ncbi:MAG: radical SAM protein, partial [candidate division WOR-3 bacterium]
RNLEWWEIADQVLQISKITNKKITNVVFMGMGEPLLNFENVKQAIRVMTSHIGLNIGARHITISTSGIVPKIYELADFERRVKLAISLHSAIEEKRIKIMPIAKAYSLNELKEALMYYYERKKRKITIEYIQLKGLNDQN